MNNLSTSWSDGPIVALDLETTDTDPHRDRLVSAAVVTINPGRPGERRRVTRRTWLANPGVDIPADATEIHDITTEQARRDGRSAADVCAEVSAFLAEVWTPTTPLCAFNAAFDLTMLDAELQRYHGRRLLLSGPVIDPRCIDLYLDPHGTRRRNLSAVCAHYQVRLDKAHDSAEDAIAAARLAWQLAKTQPARVGLIDPRVLHSYQAGWYRDREFAYADKLDRRIRLLSARGGETDEVARLRARASAVRACAGVWPLLPASTADSQPVQRRQPAAWGY